MTSEHGQSNGSEERRKVAMQNHVLNMFTTYKAWYMNMLLIVKVVCSYYEVNISML
jgi:hypothetical protein